MALLDEQLQLLKQRYPTARLERQPTGAHVVFLDDYPLPPGWSKPATAVAFFLQPGYPHAAPDCFWVDPTLRLASGAMPQNSQLQVIPGTSHNWLWFSWHPGKWNPNRDSLVTYMLVITNRLTRLQ